MRPAKPPAFLLAALFCCSAAATPFTPNDDSRVLERLPLKRGDPVAKELQALRQAHTANPANAQAAVALARKYFDLASAEGDPRYIGYAEAAIQRWPDASAPANVILVRALLRQYRHDFEPALAELAAVLEREPDNTEAIGWRAALYLVQAEYAKARAECARLEPMATRLTLLACTTNVDSMTGKSKSAYEALSSTLAREPTRNAGFRAWILTRLSEMAQRMGDVKLAEKHFREALEETKKIGLPDGFVLAAYADLLLDLGRNDEVIAMLRDWTRSDVLLVRLALAEANAATPTSKQRARDLADRFAASALRGDRLHLQEESRFTLAIGRDAKKALAVALDNWKTQREPRDARVLMEAALAAGEPRAAQGALDWMRATHYEDPRYRELAARLERSGGASK